MGSSIERRPAACQRLRFQSLRRFSVGSSRPTADGSSPTTPVSIAEAILCGFKPAPACRTTKRHRFQSLRRFSVGSSTTQRLQPSGRQRFQSLRRFSVGSSGIARQRRWLVIPFQSLRRFSVGSSVAHPLWPERDGQVSIAEAILCGFKRRKSAGRCAACGMFQSLRRFSVGSSQIILSLDS